MIAALVIAQQGVNHTIMTEVFPPFANAVAGDISIVSLLPARGILFHIVVRKGHCFEEDT